VAAGDDREDSVSFLAEGVAAETFRIPLDHVKGLLVHAPLDAPAAGSSPPTGAKAGRNPSPASPAQSARLRNEILRSRPRKDLLVLLEGGKSPGVLDSIGKDGVHFSSESLGDVHVQLDKLRSVILAELGDDPKAEPKPAPAGNAPASVHVLLRDASTVVGTLAGFEQGHVKVKTRHLGEQRLSLERVVELSFRGGRLSYLSDLEPTRVEERIPLAFKPNAYPFQRDLSVVESPLRIGGREFTKGLGVHAYSQLEFDLGGAYKRFQATIGLDETARPTSNEVTGIEGAVTFRVKLDGSLLLEKPMTWKDAPEAIDLDVSQGKRLVLEVDCGKPEETATEFNSVLDRANWASARVVK